MPRLHRLKLAGVMMGCGHAQGARVARPTRHGLTPPARAPPLCAADPLYEDWRHPRQLQWQRLIQGEDVPTILVPAYATDRPLLPSTEVRAARGPLSAWPASGGLWRCMEAHEAAPCGSRHMGMLERLSGCTCTETLSF